MSEISLKAVQERFSELYPDQIMEVLQRAVDGKMRFCIPLQETDDDQVLDYLIQIAPILLNVAIEAQQRIRELGAEINLQGQYIAFVRSCINSGETPKTWEQFLKKEGKTE